MQTSPHLLEQSVPQVLLRELRRILAHLMPVTMVASAPAPVDKLADLALFDAHHHVPDLARERDEPGTLFAAADAFEPERSRKLVHVCARRLVERRERERLLRDVRDERADARLERICVDELPAPCEHVQRWARTRGFEQLLRVGAGQAGRGGDSKSVSEVCISENKT